MVQSQGEQTRTRAGVHANTNMGPPRLIFYLYRPDRDDLSPLLSFALKPTPKEPCEKPYKLQGKEEARGGWRRHQRFGSIRAVCHRVARGPRGGALTAAGCHGG